MRLVPHVSIGKLLIGVLGLSIVAYGLGWNGDGFDDSATPFLGQVIEEAVDATACTADGKNCYCSEEYAGQNVACCAATQQTLIQNLEAAVNSGDEDAIATAQTALNTFNQDFEDAQSDINALKAFFVNSCEQVECLECNVAIDWVIDQQDEESSSSSSQSSSAQSSSSSSAVSSIQSSFASSQVSSAASSSSVTQSSLSSQSSQSSSSSLLASSASSQPALSSLSSSSSQSLQSSSSSQSSSAQSSSSSSEETFTFGEEDQPTYCCLQGRTRTISCALIPEGQNGNASADVCVDIGDPADPTDDIQGTIHTDPDQCAEECQWCGDGILQEDRGEQCDNGSPNSFAADAQNIGLVPGTMPDGNRQFDAVNIPTDFANDQITEEEILSGTSADWVESWVPEMKKSSCTTSCRVTSCARLQEDRPNSKELQKCLNAFQIDGVSQCSPFVTQFVDLDGRGKLPEEEYAVLDPDSTIQKQYPRVNPKAPGCMVLPGRNTTGRFEFFYHGIPLNPDHDLLQQYEVNIARPIASFFRKVFGSVLGSIFVAQNNQADVDVAELDEQCSLYRYVKEEIQPDGTKKGVPGCAEKVLPSGQVVEICVNYPQCADGLRCLTTNTSNGTGVCTDQPPETNISPQATPPAPPYDENDPNNALNPNGIVVNGNNPVNKNPFPVEENGKIGGVFTPDPIINYYGTSGIGGGQGPIIDQSGSNPVVRYRPATGLTDDPEVIQARTEHCYANNLIENGGFDCVVGGTKIPRSKTYYVPLPSNPSKPSSDYSLFSLPAYPFDVEVEMEVSGAWEPMLDEDKRLRTDVTLDPTALPRMRFSVPIDYEQVVNHFPHIASTSLATTKAVQVETGDTDHVFVLRRGDLHPVLQTQQYDSYEVRDVANYKEITLKRNTGPQSTSGGKWVIQSNIKKYFDNNGRVTIGADDALIMVDFEGPEASSGIPDNQLISWQYQDDDSPRVLVESKDFVDPWPLGRNFSKVVIYVGSEDSAAGIDENNCPVIWDYLPTEPGAWGGGDTGVNVGTQLGVEPEFGEGMRKFVATTSFPEDMDIYTQSDLWQLVPMGEDIEVGDVIGLQGFFNRVEGDGQTDSEFTISVTAYDFPMSDFPAQSHDYLDQAKAIVQTDGREATWQKGESYFVVPPETQFLAVHIAAVENNTNDGATPEFDGHYADSICMHVLPECMDGFDNDGDGNYDMDDPHCDSVEDDSEYEPSLCQEFDILENSDFSSTFSATGRLPNRSGVWDFDPGHVTEKVLGVDPLPMSVSQTGGISGMWQFDASHVGVEEAAANACRDGVDNDGDGGMDALVELAVDLSAKRTLWTKDETSIRDFVNEQPGLTKIPVSGNVGMVNYDAASARKVCQLAGYIDVYDYDCASNYDGGRCGYSSCGDNTLAYWDEAKKDFVVKSACAMGNKWLSTLTCIGVPTACHDGKDNDGDGKIDFPEDDGCASENDTDERPHDVQCIDSRHPREENVTCPAGLDGEFGTLSGTGESGCYASSDLWQLAEVPVGTEPEAFVQSEAFFNGIGIDYETDTEFELLVRTYDFPVAQFAQRIDDHTRQFRQRIIGDKMSNTWEYASVLFQMPRDTTFFAVRVAAIENIYNDVVIPEYDAHFVDNVCLAVVPPTPPECRDGIDNDGDGAIDYPADFGCLSPEDDDESDVLAQCQDSQDNDSDGRADYPADIGCSSKQDNDETNEVYPCHAEGNLRMKIEIDVVQSRGADANAVNGIVLGDGTVVQSGEWIPLMESGVTVLDQQQVEGSPYLSVRRQNGYIDILGYGQMSVGDENNREVVYGTAIIDGGTFTSVTQLELEMFNNGTFGILPTDPDDDEVVLEENSNRAAFFMHYNTDNDSFRLYYDEDASLVCGASSSSSSSSSVSSSSSSVSSASSFSSSSRISSRSSSSVGNACTTDQDCASGELCINGICRLPVCGNGVLDPGEACDRGLANGTQGSDCTTQCRLVAGEQCVLPAQCQSLICDDGACNLCQTNEDCPAGYDCRAGDCVPSALTCGNSVVDAGEYCDDGNRNDADSCSNTCLLGDNVLCSADEQCDSNLCLNGVCSACVTDDQCAEGEQCIVGACKELADLVRPPYCGNGRVDAGEECDLGIYNSNAPSSMCLFDCRFPGHSAANPNVLSGTEEVPFNPDPSLGGQIAQGGNNGGSNNGGTTGQVIQDSDHPPVGDTGPAAVAVMAAGAAAGYAFMRRRKFR